MPRDHLTPHGPVRARRRPPLRLVAWRTRWVLAALLAGAACAVVVDELTPAPPPTTDVLVAARDLAAGHVLTRSDVRAAPVPSALVPGAGLTGVTDAVGSSLAVAVPEGLPLVPGLLARGVPHGPPGTVVAPVRFADAAVSTLLGPGIRVDVLAATEDGTPGTYLAHGALVLPAASRSGDAANGSALLGTAAPGEDAAPVLLAVTADEAAAIAGALGSAALSAVVVG